MYVFNVAPFDAMNVFDCLYDLLLPDVALVVFFRPLEVVRTQVPDLTERRIKSMKQKRLTYEMERASSCWLKETCSKKPLSLSMCWNSSDCDSKYILSGSKCFCNVAWTTSRDISPATRVLSVQPAVQLCGDVSPRRNAFA